eukprot:TRINITY_DN3072_c0_g1_i1.p1 TRINITY_DN3072_c0_g1~~TRINITY_DN3072_c0_g1_i1.p1  ORF type:complete len:365 (-),score=57.62 TRINITY_DN3072_c0_g1_i1:481-1575(-)
MKFMKQRSLPKTAFRFAGMHSLSSSRLCPFPFHRASVQICYKKTMLTQRFHRSLWMTRGLRKECKMRHSFGFCTLSAASSKLDSIVAQFGIKSGNSTPVAMLETDASSFTNVPQGSEEWLQMRKDKLTCSAFSTALGFWSKRRADLWEEKVYQKSDFVPNAAMTWGTNNEDLAVERYREITGYDVERFGFKTYAMGKDGPTWLGASPDRLIKGSTADVVVLSDGILEVKCPYNKGKPASGSPWKSVPYYYMPQIQGLMEIFDRDWLDLYCWTPNASSIFRVQRDRKYWATIYVPLWEFWWKHVVPAREALLNDDENSVLQYKPSPAHKDTDRIIKQSYAVSMKCLLLCTEVNGRPEFLQASVSS